MAQGQENRIGPIGEKKVTESQVQLSYGFLFKKFILLSKLNFSATFILSFKEH